jgi:hypothetical protein
VVAGEPITMSPRARGVEVATWPGDGRCVLAYLGVATSRWLQVADVIVCPPGPMCRRRWAVMAALPGCLVVAGELDGLCVVAIRGGLDVAVDGADATAYALTCYRWLTLRPELGLRSLTGSTMSAARVAK